MSKRARILTVSLAGLAAMAIMFLVGPVQGAKPQPTAPLSLKAGFEGFWGDGQGNFLGARILNDQPGLLYIDTVDTKKIKYGVSVKYYPSSGSNPRGQFVMKIDRAGALGRYVQMLFSDPVTGPWCASTKEGCDVDGFIGETGEVETRAFSISTQIVLDENGDGTLSRNVNAPIGMETMKTGDRKVVGLGISFAPDDPAFDYQYALGHFTDPGNYVPGSTCQEQYYPWGPAELVCLAAGQVWEFRPLSTTYVNEPNNLWRLLWGQVLIDYWTYCRLDKWEMPFVLRVSR